MVPPQVNESVDLLLSSGKLPARIDGTAFYALVRLIFHVILQYKNDIPHSQYGIGSFFFR